MAAEESGIKFLTDQHVAPAIGKIMRILGQGCIRAIKDTEVNDGLDEHWVPYATDRGWIGISCDRNMLYAPEMFDILSASGARMIFLGKHFAHYNRFEQARWFLRYWSKISAHAKTMKPGAMVHIHSNGRITDAKPQLHSRKRRKKQ